MLICDAFHICDDLGKMNKPVNQTVGFKPLKHIKTIRSYLWEGTPLQRPIGWCCLFWESCEI